MYGLIFIISFLYCWSLTYLKCWFYGEMTQWVKSTLMKVRVCSVFVCCSQLASEKALTIQQELSNHISDALDHAPSIIIFDDLDSIISSSSNLEGSQPSTSVVALTEFLTDIMDEYGVMILYGFLIPLSLEW